MKPLRVSVALLFVVLAQFLPSSTYAQVGEPTFSNRYDGRELGPNRGAGLFVSVTNTTDTPIIVSGVTMTDLVAPEACPRHWFGDAGYNERPRGENETTPPVPSYPLPSAWLDAPITLDPDEALELPMMELFMIEAAPNACQRISLSPVLDVAWEFVVAQTYGTVAGTVTDSVSGEPLTSAAVTITGTTDEGVITENLAADGNGYYASSASYHTETELTVTAISEGHTGTSATTTVIEGGNVVNVALEPIPVATGTVSGSVLDSGTGEPIANASIILTGTDAAGNQVSETVYSDAAGQYSSSIQFQAGTAVAMSISAEGYVTTETGIDSVSEGANTVPFSLNAVQIDDPTQTPSPESTETVTPSPESTETPVTNPVETETPTAEPPLATPVPSDPGSSAPPANEQSDLAQPVVSGLPSTGSGGTTSIGLLLGGALASATAIAVAIRRNRH